MNAATSVIGAKRTLSGRQNRLNWSQMTRNGPQSRADGFVNSGVGLILAALKNQLSVETHIRRVRQRHLPTSEVISETASSMERSEASSAATIRAPE